MSTLYKNKKKMNDHATQRYIMRHQGIHVKREANTMAHRLTKKALLGEEEQTWFSNFLECMNEFVLVDQEV